MNAPRNFRPFIQLVDWLLRVCTCINNEFLSFTLLSVNIHCYDTGEEEKYSKKKIRKANRHMKMILMTILASMIPMIVAAKLKFFIMMSLGLGFLGLIVGKTIMFSVLALPAAIIGAHKRHSYFVKRMDHMANHHPLSRVGTDPYAGGRHFT